MSHKTFDFNEYFDRNAAPQTQLSHNREKMATSCAPEIGYVSLSTQLTNILKK